MLNSLKSDDASLLKASLSSVICRQAVAPQFACLPTYLVKRLLLLVWSLIYGLRRFDLVSEALMSLLWLRIPERIQFKLAVLAGPSRTTRQRPRLPRTVHSAVGRSKSIITPFCIISSSSRPTSLSLDCRRKGVSGVWVSSLKQFASWHQVHRQSSVVIVLKTIILFCCSALLKKLYYSFRGLEAFYIALSHVKLVIKYYYYYY